MESRQRLEAAGETESLRELVTEAQLEPDEQTVFYDRFTMRAILFAQTMTARISHEDRAYWRAWTRQHARHAVDFVADDNDPLPGAVHALSEIYLGLKSLPRFLRSTPDASPRTSDLVTKEPS